MAISNLGSQYSTQMIYCIFFGATSGAYTVLTPVILIDLIGLDRFTLAYGLDLLAMGMGTIIGPPIVGNIPFCSFTRCILTINFQVLYMM